MYMYISEYIYISEWVGEYLQYPDKGIKVNSEDWCVYCVYSSAGIQGVGGGGAGKIQKT